MSGAATSVAAQLSDRCRHVTRLAAGGSRRSWAGFSGVGNLFDEIECELSNVCGPAGAQIGWTPAGSSDILFQRREPTILPPRASSAVHRRLSIIERGGSAPFVNAIFQLNLITGS